MTLVKSVRNPFFNMFDDLFNQDVERIFNREGSRNLPAVNVTEKDNSYDLSLVAPGLEKEDFDLHVEEDMLTISSDSEEQHEEKDGERVIRREFHKSSFTRSFTLPENVDADGITAQYNNGVLHVLLPKKEVTPKERKKQIAIG